MKKLFALLMALALVMSFAACSTPEATEPNTEAVDPVTDPAGDDTAEVMTYEEFMAAEVDDLVCIETYVQATQGWWFDTEDNTGKVTIYAQSPEGGCFVYETTCEEEVGNALVAGAKIRVTGDKKIFNGLHEIMGGTVEIVEDGDTYVAEAQDLTSLLGTEELEGYMAQYATFKGLTIEASNDAGDAFLYNWDGSGSAEAYSDLYFKASANGQSCTFVVETYLRGTDSEEYKTVQGLKVGDKVDIECFVYWYEGAQPHVTAIAIAE